MPVGVEGGAGSKRKPLRDPVKMAVEGLLGHGLGCASSKA